MVATVVVYAVVLRRRDSSSSDDSVTDAAITTTPINTPTTLPMASPLATTDAPSTAPKLVFHDVPCVNFLMVAESCMLSEGFLTTKSQEPCLRCIANAHLDASKQSCTEYIGDMCGSISTECAVQSDCPEACMTYLEDWYSCRSDACNVDCLGDGTRNEPIAISDAFACPTEAVLACGRQHIGEIFDFQECYECTDQIKTTCGEEFCQRFLDCRDVCGSCLYPLMEYYTCQLGGDCIANCNLDDINTDPYVPDPDFQPCADKGLALTSCLDGTISINLCFDCAFEAFYLRAVLKSCDEYQDTFCPAFLNCADECAGCMGETDAYFNCIVCDTTCLGDT